MVIVEDLKAAYSTILTYCTKIVKSNCVIHFEDELDSGSEILRITTFKEWQVVIPLVLPLVKKSSIVLPQPMKENVEPNKIVEEIPLRRS